MARNFLALFLGSFKNTFYLCNCQNSCSNTQTKGEMNVKPRTYYFDGLIFMPILQPRCNEDMADAFHVILPFGCETRVLTNRKSIRFFCIRTRRNRAMSKLVQLCNRQQFRSSLLPKAGKGLVTFVQQPCAHGALPLRGSTKRVSFTAVFANSPSPAVWLSESILYLCA